MPSLPNRPRTSHPVPILAGSLVPFLLAALTLAACAPTGAPEDSADRDVDAPDDDTSAPDDDSAPEDDDSEPADDDSEPADDDSEPTDDDVVGTEDDDSAPPSLDGSTYAVDLLHATWSPSALGTILSAYLDSILLLGVQSHTKTTIEMIGALGVETDTGDVVQDLCDETVALTDYVPGVFSPPEFSLGPADLRLEVSGLALDLHDASLRGRFTLDYDRIDHMEIAGAVDVSAFDAWLGGEGSTCAMLGDLGLACGPCPDGAAEACVSVTASGIAADRIPITLVPRTHEDIEADPAC